MEEVSGKLYNNRWRGGKKADSRDCVGNKGHDFQYIPLEGELGMMLSGRSCGALDLALV